MKLIAYIFFNCEREKREQKRERERERKSMKEK